MKLPKSLLLGFFLCATFPLYAQVQWYQNQDGNNPPPSGTFGSCTKNFTPNSFVACYQWSSDGDQYTWKVSKSHINGTEQKAFFATGTWASADIRVSRQQFVYVLVSSFPPGENAIYTIYKLDSNLLVKATRQITLPGNFSILSINAFETDRMDNIYLAGDGQYPVGRDMLPASFVMKADRNLNIRWRDVDSSATSFARLQIEPTGKVVVIEDHSDFFPQVKIRKYSSSGLLTTTRTMTTDPGRFNLVAKMDDDGNLLLYGGQMVGDTAQAFYIYKISRYNGMVMFYKTHFAAMGIQLNDLTLDDDGRIFALVTQYLSSGDQQCLVTRINQASGNLQWSRSFQYSTDSCALRKLVVTDADKLYVLGEKRNYQYLSKGMVMRMRKNGQQDGSYQGPDSVSFQRSHALVDGITDRNGQLITIGNTNDFDPYTFNSTYFRAFAARFGAGGGHHGCDDKAVFSKGGEAPASAEAIADESAELPATAAKLVVYPNPVQDQLTVSQINPAEYDQLAIYNMKGDLLMKQRVNGSSARFELGNVPGGVYLLVLRSSVSMKEKTIKFVVSK